MNKDHPDYIVVEGPIGVGKTTLAKRLAKSFNTELMLELATENPFLPRFYSDPKTVALPTQLFFLFQRAKQIESFRQKDMFRPIQVSDFLIEKDRLFASVTLDTDELNLYQQVYDRLTIDNHTPDLVIYLQAPTEMGMKSPEEGASASVFLLMGNPSGSGHYYGSDCVRSPFDRYRSPGDPPYTG